MRTGPAGIAGLGLGERCFVPPKIELDLLLRFQRSVGDSKNRFGREDEQKHLQRIAVTAVVPGNPHD